MESLTVNLPVPTEYFFVSPTGFETYTEGIQTLFVQLALYSGCDIELVYAGSLVMYIDSHVWSESIRTEFQDIFKPLNSRTLTFREFRMGMLKLGLRYLSRNHYIQRRTNEFVRDLILNASRESGSFTAFPIYLSDVHDADHFDGYVPDCPEITRGVSDDSNTSEIFRTKSLIGEDLEESFFAILDESTIEMLSTCFPDLFTEDNGAASPDMAECSPHILRKYEQFFELFVEPPATCVRRISFARYIARVADNAMAKIGERAANLYISSKIGRVNRKLRKLRQDRDHSKKSVHSSTTFSDSTDTSFISSGDNTSTCERYWEDAREITLRLRERYGCFYRLNPSCDIPIGEQSLFCLRFSPWREEYFTHVDYGILFKSTIADFVPGDLLSDRLGYSPVIHEGMRCFLLHLGVAVGIHPIALGLALRKCASRLLANGMSRGADLESFDTFSGFIDASAMVAMWPEELDDYQILIINPDEHGICNSHGFTLLRPMVTRNIDENGEWRGKDVIMLLQNNHFTLLKPREGTTQNIEYILKSMHLSVQLTRHSVFEVLYENQENFDVSRNSIVRSLEEFLENPSDSEP